MSRCPWYVSAAAVREYMALTGMSDFDAASDELIELCARCADNYAARNGSPTVVGPNLLRYRGPRPRQLRLFVSTETRPEGPLPQLVRISR